MEGRLGYATQSTTSAHTSATRHRTPCETTHTTEQMHVLKCVSSRVLTEFALEHSAGTEQDQAIASMEELETPTNSVKSFQMSASKYERDHLG